MSKELIERLNRTWQTMHSDLSYRPAPKLITETADRIEELEREVAGVKSLMQAEQSVAVWALKERDVLQADNARLRDALDETRAMQPGITPTYLRADAALATTPEQSLARIRNQVRDECATLFMREKEGIQVLASDEIIFRIRATKEPE